MKSRLIASACLAGTVAALFGASAQGATMPPVPAPKPCPTPGHSLIKTPAPGSLITPGSGSSFCIQPIGG